MYAVQGFDATVPEPVLCFALAENMCVVNCVHGIFEGAKSAFDVILLFGDVSGGWGL